MTAAGAWVITVRTALGESTHAVDAPATPAGRATAEAEAWSLHRELMFARRSWWRPVIADAARRADARARLDAALRARP